MMKITDARIPADIAERHALSVLPESFSCTEGSGSTPQRTAPTHPQQ